MGILDAVSDLFPGLGVDPDAELFCFLIMSRHLTDKALDVLPFARRVPGIIDPVHVLPV